MNEYSCDVELRKNSANVLQRIFIQDEEMKKIFGTYPEIIFADSTYKLLDVELPIFILMVEDGNGQSHIVAMGLLVNEDLETLQWFFEVFVGKNPACSKTAVAMTDKDLTERSVIEKVLPNCSLRLCRFHTLRTFKREITCDKLGVTLAERDFAKSHFEAMCWAQTEESYMAHYKSFVEASPAQIVQYFDTNWHVIYNQWTGIAKHGIGCFGNKTNNRLESFNLKLKSVIPTFSSIEVFFKKFFVLITSIRTERQASTAKVFLKSFHSFTNEVEARYYKYLTLYAYDLVRKELLQSAQSEKECTTYNTRINVCTCYFYMSMGLPCKHILNFRARINMEGYDELVPGKVDPGI